MRISDTIAMMERAIITDLVRRALLFSFEEPGRDMGLKLTTLVEITSYIFKLLLLNLFDGVL